MRNARLEEAQAETKIAGRNINNLRYADDTILIAENWKGAKEALDDSERWEWKSWLKILQARLPQYVDRELPDVQAGFRKGRGTRDQIANICWIIEKAREFQKTSTFALLPTPKPLTVWITTICGKFFKRWEYQTTWPDSWEICMQVKKQQLELDMGQ